MVALTLSGEVGWWQRLTSGRHCWIIEDNIWAGLLRILELVVNFSRRDSNGRKWSWLLVLLAWDADVKLAAAKVWVLSLSLTLGLALHLRRCSACTVARYRPLLDKLVLHRFLGAFSRQIRSFSGHHLHRLDGLLLPCVLLLEHLDPLQQLLVLLL